MSYRVIFLNVSLISCFLWMHAFLRFYFQTLVLYVKLKGEVVFVPN
jgi:hypothetical protein